MTEDVTAAREALRRALEARGPVAGAIARLRIAQEQEQDNNDNRRRKR